MKKTILGMIIASISLFAASVDFAQKHGYINDYEKALNLSKEQKKPIMMMISTKTCPWCRKLEASTLRKNMVNDYIQNSYIPMSIIRDQDSYPKKFKAPVVPYIYFIDENENILGEVIGYKPADKFLEKLKNLDYSLKPIIKSSPYSLENLKELEVKFFDKSKQLTKKEKTTLKNKIKKELEKIGINTSPKEYSNIVFKVESINIGKNRVLNVTLRIIEDVIPKRDTDLESIAVTYYKNDLFEVEDDILSSVEESIFDYLLEEFIKQYQEENKK